MTTSQTVFLFISLFLVQASSKGGIDCASYVSVVVWTPAH